MTTADGMRERPILMSAPMVRALLENRKSQTRRVIKLHDQRDFFARQDGKRHFWFRRYDYDDPRCADGSGQTLPLYAPMCPYGVPGDRLWVRESYMWVRFEEADGVDDWAGVVQYGADSQERIIYQCDAPISVGMWPGAAIRKYEGKKRPSIFMPRWACRLVLEVTDVRVQRVQEISEGDVLAEGTLIPVTKDHHAVMPITGHPLPSEFSPDPWESWNQSDYIRLWYARLWDSINGKKHPWSSDPWVWVISFRRVEV